MKRYALLTSLLGLLPTSNAFAGDGVNGADTAWILTSTALVLFMTLPGLALFYGGLVRSKNVLSVLMQCFAITCVATIIWVIVGYSIAFGDGGSANAVWGGLSRAFLADMSRDALAGSIPETVFSMFQLTFAIITPALIVGGFAERMRFSAMLMFSAIWLLLVYLPICHWVWGGGWLGDMGLLDFAGGTVVHITAGVAAIVTAMVLGNRRGFPHTAMMPHNMTMTITGAGMLWVGWFGFNAGSALSAGGDAGMAMLVTHISAAMGAFTWMMIEWKRYGKPSALGAVTGMVAGLGTITPASGFVGPMAALFIGFAAGSICFFATVTIKQRLHIDDSLDVFPVHGVGGILGTMSAGIFVASGLGGAGLADGVGMAQQVGVQALGVIATVGWTALATWLILKLVGVLVELRVDEEDEIVGLDLSAHEESGYNL
ncbi:MAG: ammonium transporter [Gammaproteobacteria bacterium]|nr:ammonium transporter [Gammaproteobacteria bacterium]